MERSLSKRHTRDRDDANIKRKEAKIDPEAEHPFLTYDVLRIIFKYLSGMDLSTAAMVCRYWLQAANDEKRTRNGPVFFMECYDDLPLKHICLNTHKQQIIKNLSIKPVLGLFFKTRIIDAEDTGCHSDVLPSNCQTVTLRTKGIVFNNREIEDFGPEFVCTFLPEIPNVTVKTFIVQVSDRHSITNVRIQSYSNQYYKELCQALGKPKANDNKSKCLLMFSSMHDTGITKNVLMLLKERYVGQKISIWGGAAQYIFFCNSGHKSDQHIRARCLDCVGIVLTGAIRSWSIVIDMKHTKREQVEEKLRLLKDSVQLQKYSVGFMFACNARGRCLFRERNVESSIFKKLFPELPLVGCFGDGEYGSNTVDGESTNSAWFYYRSTVFMILTYG